MASLVSDFCVLAVILGSGDLVDHRLDRGQCVYVSAAAEGRGVRLGVLGRLQDGIDAVIQARGDLTKQVEFE